MSSHTTRITSLSERWYRYRTSGTSQLCRMAHINTACSIPSSLIFCLPRQTRAAPVIHSILFDCVWRLHAFKKPVQTDFTTRWFLYVIARQTREDIKRMHLLWPFQCHRLAGLARHDTISTLHRMLLLFGDCWQLYKTIYSKFWK